MQTLAPEAALSQFQLVASQNTNVYIKKNKCRVGFPDFCRASLPLMDPERLRKTRTKVPSSPNVNGGFCIQEQKVGSKLRIIRAQAVTTGDAMCRACGLCRRLLIKPTCANAFNQWLVYHFSFIQCGRCRRKPPHQGQLGTCDGGGGDIVRQAQRSQAPHLAGAPVNSAAPSLLFFGSPALPVLQDSLHLLQMVDPDSHFITEI